MGRVYGYYRAPSTSISKVVGVGARGGLTTEAEGMGQEPYRVKSSLFKFLRNSCSAVGGAIPFSAGPSQSSLT